MSNPLPIFLFLVTLILILFTNTVSEDVLIIWFLFQQNSHQTFLTLVVDELINLVFIKLSCSDEYVINIYVMLVFLLFLEVNDEIIEQRLYFYLNGITGQFETVRLNFDLFSFL